MPYSYDRWLGIFYVHYIDITFTCITHDTTFGYPVGGTGGNELIAH